jgi:hypothetical protein
LAWRDVSISKDNRALHVFLKRSKTNQFMRGTEVFLCSTGDDLCPVSATLEYVASRGTLPGEFFWSAEGPRFVELVRSALTRVGFPVGGFCGHSFCIGAAAAASQAGIPDFVIQAQGRWTNPTFLHYVQTPQEHFDQYSPQGPARR